MADQRTGTIRNVAIVGGTGGGKTSLVEALLVKAGTIGRAGTVEDGSTVCDSDAIEKELGRSLDSALVHFDHGGAHMNVIDTPGGPDFIGRSMAMLAAVETVILTVGADHGVDTVARRMMKTAASRDLPCMVVINKIDTSTDLGEIYEALTTAFGDKCLPVNLPAEGGASVADCFSGTEGDSDLGSIEEFHTKILDQIVEVDEELMELYLEGGEIPTDRLRSAFKQALREGHLVPVLFVSAKEGAGIDELLDAIVELCPSPTEGNPRPFESGEGDDATSITPSMDADDPLIAHVFKISADPFVGKLSIFKVHQGSLKAGDSPRLDDDRKPVRLAHFFKLQGDKHVEVKNLVAGDIGAVSKVDEIKRNSVLHDGSLGEHLHLRALELPRPMQGIAVTPEKRGSEAKLADALAKLTGEDPTLVLERVVATKQTVIRGMGEMHLRVTLRRLTEQYGVPVLSEPPKVAYKETITSNAEGHHRHKKQSGGAGQFGEVFLRVAPIEEGEFEFEDATVGGSIPKQFLPANEKGIRQVLTDGAIAGYPLQKVKVSVYDGKHHPVDSKEIAFITAGKRAFIAAVQKAKPVLLEPIVAMEITCPEDSIGDVGSDLASHRGRMLGTDMLGGGQALIRGTAPLSEVADYAGRLRSMTGGAGSFTMEYSHDEPTPANVQQEVIASFQPHSDED